MQSDKAPFSNRFPAGTTSYRQGEYIIPPLSTPEREEQLQADARMHRIDSAAGAVAAESMVAGSIPIGPGFLAEVVRRADAARHAETQVQDTRRSLEVQAKNVNSYDGPASRQAALEYAEIENIKNEAARRGMNVDEWKDARRKGLL